MLPDSQSYGSSRRPLIPSRFRSCGATLRMANILLFGLVAAIGGTCLAQTATTDPSAVSRETLSLDQGWQFHLGDIPITDFKANADEAEGGGKGASAWGAAAPKYDDHTWRVLDLPHDWEIEQPFDQHQKASAGIPPARHRVVPAAVQAGPRPTAARTSNCSLMEWRRTAPCGSTARRCITIRVATTRFISMSRRWCVTATI